MTDRISIKADREYLREIFIKIDSGEYAVPVFQRDFVWKQNQIIDLFDSILRGYPIGSLVLWKSADIHQSKNIMTDEVMDTPLPNYFILDGRQRLTTLYGVISSDEQKDARFKLYFNLEKQTFEYSQKEMPFLVKVSVVYDTFLLLDWMSDLPNKIKNEEKVRSYIFNAKNLNSLLQEYVVSEILISQCSLNEAGVVFSRINSTGTRIESFDTLQALKYTGDNSALISSYIQKIQKRLAEFDFQGISAKDILNCCFWYTDRKYYDSKIESLDKENLEVIFPSVEEALVRAVLFLRNHCGVITARLLPYTKQLLALVWVFKDNDETDPARIAELRRWFFYTTYNQMFMNGALPHIRNIHNHLEQFIAKKQDTAWDYVPVSKPKFDYRFSSRAAQTRFMVLAIINDLVKNGNVNVSDISFGGFDHVFEGNSPLDYSPRIFVKGERVFVENTALAERSEIKERLYHLELEFLRVLGLEVKNEEAE